MKLAASYTMILKWQSDDLLELPTFFPLHTPPLVGREEPPHTHISHSTSPVVHLLVRPGDTPDNCTIDLAMTLCYKYINGKNWPVYNPV